MTDHDPLRDQFAHLADELRQPGVAVPPVHGVYRRAARRRTVHLSAVLVAVLALFGGALAEVPGSDQTEAPAGPSSHLLTPADADQIFPTWMGPGRWHSVPDVPVTLRSDASCAPGLDGGRTEVLAVPRAGSSDPAASLESTVSTPSDPTSSLRELKAAVASCVQRPPGGGREPRTEADGAVVYENDMGCPKPCSMAAVLLEYVVLARSSDRVAVVSFHGWAQDTATDDMLGALASRVAARLGT